MNNTNNPKKYKLEIYPIKGNWRNWYNLWLLLVLLIIIIYCAYQSLNYNPNTIDVNNIKYYLNNGLNTKFNDNVINLVDFMEDD